MELNRTTGTLLANEIVLEHKEELPIEMDFVLPDDCPDIVKILKTTLRLGAVSTDAGAEGVALEGVVIANVQYIADNGLLHTAESRSNFNRTCRYDSADSVQPDRVWVRVHGEAEYINARAVNQRRVEIRGAMALYPQASATQGQSYLADCGGEGMECRFVSRELTYPMLRAQYSFSVDEERALPAGLPELGTILRCEGRAVLTDHKIMEGKVVTKGDLILRCVYLPADADSEHDSPAAAVWTLPISCLAEPEGIDEETACCLSYSLEWVMAEPKLDENGDRRGVQCRAEVRLNCTAHRSETLSGVSDAFALSHPVELARKTVTVPQLVSCIDLSVPVSKSYELPMSGISEVFDVWGHATVGAGHRQDDGVSLPIRLELCALVRDSNGRPAIFERSEDIAQLIPGDGDSLMARDLMVSVADISCALSGEAISFNTTLALTGCLYERVKLELLEDMAVDETIDLPRPASALTLYYADAGSELWDIAKQFGTTVGSLKMENDLTGDTLDERTMLMVVSGR